METGKIGGRIRERRRALGLRQTALAHTLGISPSYLNLIEHDRRAIGGKLLNALARELKVDPQALRVGAQAALCAGLTQILSDEHLASSAMPREALEPFAEQFPGWASTLLESHRRIRALEQNIAMLNDRLAHDPEVAASLHAVLTQATAIRSTAAILAETQDISPEWQYRFYRNLNQNSARLAENSQALVRFLENDAHNPTPISTPREEFDEFLEAHKFSFPTLETRQDISKATEHLLAHETLCSQGGREIAARYLQKYAEDARILPTSKLIAALDFQEKRTGLDAPLPSDPFALAALLRLEPGLVLRRMATLPQTQTPHNYGLAICDMSGSFLYRKALIGFALPRFGSACAIWPLFEALSNPARPIRQKLQHLGRDGGIFQSYAIALPENDGGYFTRMHGYMLLVEERNPPSEEELRPVATTCRLCPHRDCTSRREISLFHGRADAAFGDAIIS